MARVELDGFPPVEYLQFFQGTDSRPGRCVVETRVASDSSISSLPRITTLRMEADNWSGVWDYMRVTQPPKVRYGKMRIVLQDSRWYLGNAAVSVSANWRTPEGRLVDNEHKKTIAELVDLISDASGTEITTTEDVPDMYPAFHWEDKLCNEALDELLEYTGCRCVYLPESRGFSIVQANVGALPRLTNQIFRGAPPPRVGDVQYFSQPTLYEGEISCKAVKITDDGKYEQLEGTELLAEDREGDHTRYRLWQPDNPSNNRVFFNTRAKSDLNGNNMPKQLGWIKRDNWPVWPAHSAYENQGDSVTAQLKATENGSLFITDHPIMVRDSGNDDGPAYETELECVCSWYERDSGGAFTRLNKTVSNSGSGTIYKLIPWIRPIDSTLDDVGNSQWQQVLNEAASAMNQFHAGDAGTFRFSAPRRLGASGQIGAVQYNFQLGPDPKIIFFVAKNFNPGSMGSIR